MWIDESNVADYIGVTVDAKKRLFHNYPLTILKKSFGYCFRDSTDTIVMNDFQREPVFFDTVLCEIGG